LQAKLKPPGKMVMLSNGGPSIAGRQQSEFDEITTFEAELPLLDQRRTPAAPLSRALT
jgi:hypothetical protein